MRKGSMDDQSASDELQPFETSLNIAGSSSGHRLSDDEAFPAGSRSARPSSDPTSSVFASSIPRDTAPSNQSMNPSRSPQLASSSSNISRPLSTLASSSMLQPRRSAHFDDSLVSSSSISDQLPTAQKDADDPTTPLDARRSIGSGDYGTSATISRLFTEKSPGRAPGPDSYTGPLYMRSLASEGAALPDHLFTRGLLEGRHSDITVIAFGQSYLLHRLILDRSAFFSTALSARWMDSNSKELTLHPEDIDASITKTAFELALKRLYGCESKEEEEAEAVALFATGCWLEMQDLIDSSIEAILRQMSPETLSPLIKLVTANYYGAAGERVLSSAKCMLCRDGWEMRTKYWDNIPGDIIREIVGGDGFFVESEWDRWYLSKRLLNHRLKRYAVEAGIIRRGQERKVKLPASLSLMAVRFDAVYRKNTIITGRQTPEIYDQWVSLYTHPEIEPLLVLLDEGIHYIHMDFEQLQFIRGTRDVFGLPLISETVITNALWQQMELRQRVLNADDLSLELGLSHSAANLLTSRTSNAWSSNEGSSVSKGKQRGDCTPEEEEDDMDSGSWDANGKPRKFWIPSADCNIVMGANADPVVTTSTPYQRQASRLSASLQPEDVQWATDFASSPSNITNAARSGLSNLPARPRSASGSNAGQPRPMAYTHFPPFRFSVEFPNPRQLKEKKRVYSRTVFYAGSLWNIYVQKVRSVKNPQLGVYLHRAKERETEAVLTGTAQGPTGTVDERIGMLEREMLLRSERRQHRRGRVRFDGNALSLGAEEYESDNDNDGDSTLVSSSVRRNNLFTSSARFRYRRPSLQSDESTSPTLLNLPAHLLPHHGPLDHVLPWDDSSDTDADDYTPSDPTLASATNTRSHHAYAGDAYPASYDTARQQHQQRAVPTIPPYVDGRPTIKTYFKIYSPSKGGRMLSVYESAPDRFNFSQSWGWKSGTLMLDEGFASAPATTGATGSAAGSGSGGENRDSGEAAREEAAGDENGKEAKGWKRKGEGRLRFMVVIGNL